MLSWTNCPSSAGTGSQMDFESRWTASAIVRRMQEWGRSMWDPERTIESFGLQNPGPILERNATPEEI